MSKKDVGERHAEAVDDLAKLVANLSLTLLVTCTYLAITTLAVSHEMLLRETPVRLPLIDVSLPIRPFFQIVPILLFALHVNLMVQLELLRRRLCRLRQVEDAWEQWSPGLYPAVAVQRWALGADSVRLRRVFHLVFYVSVALFPWAVLFLMEFRFLPYQHVTSWLHVVVVTADLMLLVVFLIWLPARDRACSLPVKGDPSRRSWLWMSLSLVLGLLAQGIVLGVPDLRRLEVRDRLLVAASPPPEVQAALLREGLTPERILRDHSTGLNLNGRSLRYADLTGSRLFNAKLRGADLTGALLVEADLSGADLNPGGVEEWAGAGLPPGPERWALLPRLATLLDEQEEAERGWVVAVLRVVRRILGRSPAEGKTRLVGADLTGARLVEVPMMFADLSGATLDGAHLEGAALSRARLDGATMLRTGLAAADLVATTLRNVEAADADFNAAALQEADLTGANLTGASLIAADLTKSQLYLTRLFDTDLRAANFQSAVTIGVNLHGSKLWGAHDLYASFAMLRQVKAAGACLCERCDDLAEGDAHTYESTVDTAGFDDSTPGFELPASRWCDLLPVIGVETASHTALAERSDRLPLARQAEQELQRLIGQPVATCRPIPHTDPAGFYRRLASHLVWEACGREGLAEAVAVTAVRDDRFQRPLPCQLAKELRKHLYEGGWCDAFDRLEETLGERLARALEEAPEECPDDGGMS